METIYYYGKNKVTLKKFKKIVLNDYIFVKVNQSVKIPKNSLLIVDLTTIKHKKQWKKVWPSFLPKPLELAAANIEIIAIIKREQNNLAMQLLKSGFNDFLQVEFDKPRVLGTLLNTIHDIYYERELTRLYEIGIKLSFEQNLEKLLQMILEASLDFTNSDGGSIYLVTKDKDKESGEKLMQFERSLSDTLGSIYQKRKMPINEKSLAGFCIKNGKLLNIKDVYKLPKNAPYKFNSKFDEKNNYRSRSMLVVPMINHKQEVIGALQLINRKSNRKIKLKSKEIVKKVVINYDHKCEMIIRSFASQATIAVETNQLYKQIHDLFESFMKASAIAVESRDPSTAGHSKRVSELCIAIAKEINKINKGPLKKIKFNKDELIELEYAGLLHDFGKIGVKENILIKAKKLFSEELANLDIRFEVLKYSLYNFDKKSREEVIETVEKIKQSVHNANEPGNVDSDIFDMLKYANETDFYFLNRQRQKALSDKEFERLTKSRGSLSAEEYKIIQSHVEHSYKFLNEISWTNSLQNVPVLARYHHEKLDGSGYPLGIKGDEIPIGSQIMCIADIFDALISSDRPYKSRITLDKALFILKNEAADGKVNKDILELFINNKIYKQVYSNLN